LKPETRKKILSARILSIQELKIIGEHLRNLSLIPWRAAARKRSNLDVVARNDVWENVGKAAISVSVPVYLSKFETNTLLLL